MKFEKEEEGMIWSIHIDLRYAHPVGFFFNIALKSMILTDIEPELEVYYHVSLIFLLIKESPDKTK